MVQHNMDGCLLIGGKAPDRKLLGPRIHDWDIIVAADSGLHHARNLGLVPSEIIGDFDSVEQGFVKKYPNIIIHQHERDKDETDTELGIELLRTRGAARIHIVGGGGGRLDHLYAILSLFHRDDPPDFWYTHREQIQLIQGKMSVRPGKNRRVSFFPLGLGPCSMKTSGLKWPLDELCWKVGDFGISNIATHDEIKIEMKKGKLIMVYDLGNEDSV